MFGNKFLRWDFKVHIRSWSLLTSIRLRKLCRPNGP
ncbi:hypothetical protein T4A_2693 [Trichinella pseudospiralis]|uniref:Uncharacterized protein n=1 Tax=Trichinella pseudospiralis TaxID=6337 RepID=A0A0V1C390_TRIPS|nr:hypothetical protein T4A_2693 [Trichinella pseudospiralis]